MCQKDFGSIPILSSTLGAGKLVADFPNTQDYFGIERGLWRKISCIAEWKAIALRLVCQIRALAIRFPIHLEMAVLHCVLVA